jgi:hypothetical protein
LSSSYLAAPRLQWRWLQPLLVIAMVAGFFAVAPGVAEAAPSLTVTRTTWDVIGMRSNITPAHELTSPRRFPVGVEICNTGAVTASGVSAAFALSNVQVASGSQPAIGSVQPQGGTSATGANQTIGDLAAGACRQVYYTVRVAPQATNKPQLTGAFGKTSSAVMVSCLLGALEVTAGTLTAPDSVEVETADGTRTVSAPACAAATATLASSELAYELITPGRIPGHTQPWPRLPGRIAV